MSPPSPSQHGQY
jgi:hypothetical protein